MKTYSLSPIGIVHSCFKEKFAIPRQPQLAPAAKGWIELSPPYNSPQAVAGLEKVSHIWLTFIFHKNIPAERNCSEQGLTNEKHIRVRPPRLGGNEKLGVFASRATHRPNPIGQSVVKLDKIENGQLHISGLDLLDGTPILDIKPYVPYADIITDASNAIADKAPELLQVNFTDQTLQQAKEQQQTLQQSLIELIEQMLAQDPRPAYQALDKKRIYGVTIYHLNIQWQYIDDQHIQVMNIQPI